MAKKFTCPRRVENGMEREDGPFRGAGPNLDSFKSGHGLVGQKRGCSYCGSMSPDDFLEAAKNGGLIGPTDKSYKLYLDTPTRGKFYTQHFSVEQGHEFWLLLQANELSWRCPGGPYVPLYLPGPSTKKD